ncbi:MAG: hypothetical protein D4R63_10375 [Methylococcaceae bacterium]|nr:MAG: hypothetical protein D4R63_10375 [Methylococcaceae bacterium]
MPDEAIAVSRQCKLLAISRSVIYAHKKRQQDVVDDDEGLLLQLLDDEYTRHPFYGTRRMTQYLRGLGYVVNRKRVQRLMRTLGLAGMAPGPNTSKPHPQHKVYPYLLRGVEITAPNQVWSTDITYIRLRHGFVYLVASFVPRYLYDLSLLRCRCKTQYPIMLGMSKTQFHSLIQPLKFNLLSHKQQSGANYCVSG